MFQGRADSGSKVEDVLYRSAVDGSHEVLGEDAFRHRMALERKRTERNKDPFLLMLLDDAGPAESRESRKHLDDVITALVPITRETDAIGWYKDGNTVGVIFTGLPDCDKGSLLGTILSRVRNVLRGDLTHEQFSRTRVSFYFFPDEWDEAGSPSARNLALYPDLLSIESGRRVELGIKRMIDIAGSIALLIILAPLFLVIAIVIKCTSEGPVLFRQERVGQYGKRFVFLKFRSMHFHSDHRIHMEYVKKLIAGNAERIPLAGSEEGVYKLVNDGRITRVGKYLRKSSLDELPQLLNVLRGEMSLVGPRPPIPYELSAYETWHRRRLLQVKPGITGLWQVGGRNRIPFDDMVRLDLHYAERWTPWLDLIILLRTPIAVIRGAY